MVSKVQNYQHHQYLKKKRGLYEISDESNKEWETRRKQLNSLSSLSLFSHQELGDPNEETAEHSYDTERPVTPINDSIKSAPKTYAGFSKLIHRRINPRHEWDHISVDDQSSLGGVIMGEVNAVWPVLRRQVADPFLTNQQNKELQRRITIHCVTVCEQLFLHYSAKIKLLNARGVFSNPANLSRIRAQLALDAGKYLNILSVRRHITNDLKKPSTKDTVTYDRGEISRSPTTPVPPQSPRHLSFHQLVESSRPRKKLKYQFNLNAELQSMRSQMPTLNIAKIQHLLPSEEHSIFRQTDNVLEEEYDEMSEEEQREENSLTPSARRHRPKHRCPSEPMPRHELLLEELNHRQEEDDESPGSPSRMQLGPGRSHSSMLRIRPQSLKKSETSMGLDRAPSGELENLDATNPAEDLRILVAKQERARLKDIEDEKNRGMESLNDIPPLIQALTRKEAQNEKVRKLKIQEEELNKKAKEEEEEMRKPLPEPLYPQPAVVQQKLPGIANPVDHTPITIRASDVKINDCVDLSTVTLEPYLPIYNDLTGEISQTTVKELDANLFQGGELREVYAEIMKTVPNIHQHYDNDPLIVNPGTNVDLSSILASSTLTRPRSQQVINPKLRRDESNMMWEVQQLDFGRTAHAQQHSAYPFSETTSHSQVQGETVTAFHQFTPSQLNHPGVEKGSRAYASWLAWWKSTINTDDYFKYLSTQDTDFLSVLFHFYDSDAAESETDSMRTARLEAQRERDQKMAELRKEKEEFNPGLWNVKAVMLGGLGKDPEIEEEVFSEFGMSQGHLFSPEGSKNITGSETMSPRSSRPSKSQVKGLPRKAIKPSIESQQQRSTTRKHVAFTKAMDFQPGFKSVLFTESTRPAPIAPISSCSGTPVELSNSPSESSFLDENLSLKSSNFADSPPNAALFQWMMDNDSSSLDSSLSSSSCSITSLTDQYDSDSTLIPSSGVKSTQRSLKSRRKCSGRSRMRSSLNKKSLKFHDKFGQDSSRDSIENESDTTETTVDAVSLSTGSSYEMLKQEEDEETHELEESLKDESSKAEDFGISGKIQCEKNVCVSGTEGEESSGYYSGGGPPEPQKITRPGGHIKSTLSDIKETSCTDSSGERDEDTEVEKSKIEIKIPLAETPGRKGRDFNVVKFAEEPTPDRKSKRKLRRLRKQGRTVETSEFINQLNPYKQLKSIISKTSGSSRKRTSMGSSKTHDGSLADTSKSAGTAELTVQERLEIIWRKLKMPDSQKLDFALKYSADKFIKKLANIVSSWELATDLILKREEHMRKLEMFEKDASDPNRFFQRGHRGSSVVRLSEAKTRASLYKTLENMEKTLKASLVSIKMQFSDVVTYSGRPYMEKMSWDKIEMLYWLQQERRCTMLKDHGHPQQLELFLQYGKANTSTKSTSQISPRYTQLPLHSVKIGIPE